MLLFFRKRKAIKKVESLSISEKENLLETLINPFGYTYDSTQDIFLTTQDAPQKKFGYTSAYDSLAANFNMVFDYEPIYFDYNNRTWLIQVWKGQYGINSGCELGIYYANEIVPPEKYTTTLFHAVENSDQLLTSIKLNRHPSKKEKCCTRLGQIRSRHWWPSIFRMGVFSNPEQLFMCTSIRFKDYAMLRSFIQSFEETLPENFYKTNGLTVYFTFSKSTRKYSFFQRTIRRFSLFSCKTLCRWFNHLTRPFCISLDKLLYLYYYLPFTMRLLFPYITQK